MGDLRQRVRDEVSHLVNFINLLHKTNIPLPKITFDLNGGAAGQCRLDHLRFNLQLLYENTEKFIHNTVAHEVAHHAQNYLFRTSKAHGPEWRQIMQSLGRVPNRCHDYDISSVRRSRRRANRNFIYSCNCSNREHKLTSIRHKRISQGKIYKCIHCKSKINFKNTSV